MTGRAVFDCMIFLQAAANPAGPSAACFDRLAKLGLALCISPPVLLELGDVLMRPELHRKFPRLTPEKATTFLDEIERRALVFSNVPQVFSLPRDLKDEPYLNLAIAASADYLVTWNQRHLTYLMQKDTPEGKEFCRRFPELTILDPVAFLRDAQRFDAKK